MQNAQRVIIEEPVQGIRYEFRGFEPSVDSGVIFSPWCNQIRKINPFDQFNKQEFSEHRELIGKLVSRCSVTLACHPEHQDQVFGWICGELQGENQVLHFVYVRSQFRQFGIGTKLMEHVFPKFKKETLYYTHPTFSMSYLEKKWLALWNPYLVNSND